MSDNRLARLVAAGLLQAKPPDVRRVTAWLDRSRKDLDIAEGVLAGVDRDRAMAVAYEAGYRACAGMLDLAGYGDGRPAGAAEFTQLLKDVKWLLEHLESQLR